MPGAADAEVLAWAARDGRILLTFDKDFGELAFRSGRLSTAGVVLCRFRMASPEQVAEHVVTALASRGDWTGHFSVIEQDRIRMTPLPGGEATR
jgi:predicted nuclease of predicted toxin-antitoxin system